MLTIHVCVDGSTSQGLMRSECEVVSSEHGRQAQYFGAAGMHIVSIVLNMDDTTSAGLMCSDCNNNVATSSCDIRVFLIICNVNAAKRN